MRSVLLIDCTGPIIDQGCSVVWSFPKYCGMCDFRFPFLTIMPVEGESSLSLRLEAIKRDRLRVQFLSLLKLFQKLMRARLQNEARHRKAVCGS